MRRVAPCASKRDTLLHCGNNVKGGTAHDEARETMRWSGASPPKRKRLPMGGTLGMICDVSAIFDVRGSFEKGPRVFVLGPFKYASGWTLFDEYAAVHDRNPSADLTDHFEIM